MRKRHLSLPPHGLTTFYPVIPQKVFPQEVIPQEVIPQEVGPQEVGPQEVGLWEVILQEVILQEVIPREVSKSSLPGSPSDTRVFNATCQKAGRETRPTFTPYTH